MLLNRPDQTKYLPILTQGTSHGRSDIHRLLHKPHETILAAMTNMGYKPGQVQISLIRIFNEDMKHTSN
jgi:hypothetical protein